MPAQQVSDPPAGSGDRQWEMEGCKDKSLHNAIYVIRNMDFAK